MLVAAAVDYAAADPWKSVWVKILDGQFRHARYLLQKAQYARFLETINGNLSQLKIKWNIELHIRYR